MKNTIHLAALIVFNLLNVIRLVQCQRPLSANASLPTQIASSNNNINNNVILSNNRNVFNKLPPSPPQQPAEPPPSVQQEMIDSDPTSASSLAAAAAAASAASSSSGVIAIANNPLYPQLSTFQANRGRKHTFTDLRKNLSAQKKLWDSRQGDDPERNENNKNPMWVLKEKFKTGVSIPIYNNNLHFFYFKYI